MSDENTSHVRTVLVGVLKAFLILTPIWLMLGLAFGPLYSFTALNVWWPVACMVVSFVLALCVIDCGRSFVLFIMACLLIFLLSFFGGEKVFGRGAVVYDPPDHPASIEKTGQNGFYPWWRMENRVIIRNIADESRNISEEGRYIAAGGEMLSFTVSVGYRIPDHILIAHYEAGTLTNYERDVRQGLEKAIAIVQRAEPAADEALFDALKMEVNRQLAHLGGPVNYLKVTYTFGQDRAEISSTL